MADEYSEEAPREVRDWSKTICPLTLVTPSASLCYGATCPMHNPKYNSCSVVTLVKSVGYNMNQVGRAAYAFNRSLFHRK